MKLFTREQLLKTYSNKKVFLNLYPHHYEKWNDKINKFETVFEIRGKSKTQKENFNLIEEELNIYS